MLSLPHLVVLFLIALVVFGPQKLPELARMLGKATAEFRKMTNDFRFALEDEVRELERQTRIREEEVKAAALAAAAPVPTPAPSPDGTVAREQTKEAVSAPAEPVLDAGEPEQADSGSSQPKPAEAVIVPHENSSDDKPAV
jgi:sec-independent protein translocase protein TatB